MPTPRAFNHRTRAFSHVKHGQARRHAPEPGQAEPCPALFNRSPSGRQYLHVPPVVAASPSPAGRRAAAESLPPPSGLVPRHPHGHQALLAAVGRMAVREIFSLISAGLTRGVQISDLAASHNLETRAPTGCLYHCLGFQLDTLTLRRCAAVAS